MTIPTPDDDSSSVRVRVGNTSAGESFGGDFSLLAVSPGGNPSCGKIISAGKSFGGDSSVWPVFPGGGPSVAKLFGSKMTLVSFVMP